MPEKKKIIIVIEGKDVKILGLPEEEYDIELKIIQPSIEDWNWE